MVCTWAKAQYRYGVHYPGLELKHTKDTRVKESIWRNVLSIGVLNTLLLLAVSIGGVAKRTDMVLLVGDSIFQ